MLGCPLDQESVAVARLLCVGATYVVNPAHEHILVAVEHEEAAQHDIRLLVTLLAQSATQHDVDAGQRLNVQLFHRSAYEPIVLLRSVAGWPAHGAVFGTRLRLVGKV